MKGKMTEPRFGPELLFVVDAARMIGETPADLAHLPKVQGEYLTRVQVWQYLVDQQEFAKATEFCRRFGLSWDESML